MAGINFNDGFETFTINEDPNRVIRINPKDGNILTRFEEAMKDLSNESEKLADIKVKADGTPGEGNEATLEESADRLRSFNRLINDKMNYIFNSDVTEAAFGKQSPLSLIGPDNRFLFEVFLKAALEAVKEKLEESIKDSERRIGKYTDKYKRAAGGSKKNTSSTGPV